MSPRTPKESKWDLEGRNRVWIKPHNFQFSLYVLYKYQLFISPVMKICLVTQKRKLRIWMLLSIMNPTFLQSQSDIQPDGQAVQTSEHFRFSAGCSASKAHKCSRIPTNLKPKYFWSQVSWKGCSPRYSLFKGKVWWSSTAQLVYFSMSFILNAQCLNQLLQDWHVRRSLTGRCIHFFRETFTEPLQAGPWRWPWNMLSWGLSLWST